jgi:hypothetical protein
MLVAVGTQYKFIKVIFSGNGKHKQRRIAQKVR